MLLLAVRDVIWRWRRFLVALVATAVVLALTLVLDGVDNSFPNEARRTVAAFGADSWLVPLGASGVFTSSATLAADIADTSAPSPGVTTTAAIGILGGSLVDGDRVVDVNLIGVQPGRFTDPPLDEGRAAAASGEVVVDDRADVDLGATVQISGRPYTVVGRTAGITYFAGQPAAFLTLGDVQAIGYGGQPLASAIAMRGQPEAPPDGFTLLDNDQVRDDLLAPIKNARKTISLVLALLWLVAAMVIGSVIYLTSLDRARDFAVLKATGASDRALIGGLVLQSGLLSGAACVLGVVISSVLAPVMPMEPEIGTASYVQIVLVAVGVAAVASLVTVRRPLRADPALAFAGA